MTVRIDTAQPPLREVAALGAKATQVYSLLWEAAAADNRGYCGGTTDRTVAGIADVIGSKRETVSRAIDHLLDSGFISIVGSRKNAHGKASKVFRVIHPDHIEAQRYAISMFAEAPSVRAKTTVKTKTIEVYQDELFTVSENPWYD